MHMLIRSYSMVGLRGDADFLLWQATDTLESLQDTATSLWRTGLGGYLTQPYSYLAMTHRSQYVGQQCINVGLLGHIRRNPHHFPAACGHLLC